jgi:hypothetical protein
MACYHIHGEHNVTFVHIPKNAGTSIFQWLRANRGNSQFYGWHGHPMLANMRQECPDIKFVLTSVRNPWARMVSYYAMIRDQYHSTNLLRDYFKMTYWPDFNEFTVKLPAFEATMANMARIFKRFNSIHYSILDTQSAWLSGETADMVLRQEHLDEDFVQLQDLMSCREPLPCVNTTQHEDYRTYYSSETKQLVANWFEQDIDTWEYTF